MADGEALASVREQLIRDRHALLDLSTRNRLLNVPLRAARVRTIEVVDERSQEVFKSLTAGRAFTFVPGRQLSEAERAELEPDDTETGAIPQPDEEIDEGGLARRHTDLRLQTRLTSEGLQKRLFDVWYDAHTLEEEQGVNILYLAVGLLRWYDTDTSEVARHAPLLLLPVQLERTSAAEKFKLKARPEPVSANLTLQAKMKNEFSMLIEDLADEDEVDIAAYFDAVAETVRGKLRWEVLPDAMVLGFFSFAKFLMYRDLDPENWPQDAAIDRHPLVSGLLRDGFPDTPAIADDAGKIDGVVTPAAMKHVVDADSSQALAIEEAAGGRTLVVKGPPGTGKSQTITNIIAAAAAQGRKVLFVAEKMAALDVVHRRLKQAGLGALTLELHSSKANKRSILEELRRTRDMATGNPPGDVTVVERLGELTNALNAHAERLHQPLPPSQATPYQVLSRLVAAQNQGAPRGFQLDGAELWTPAQVQQREVALADLIEQLNRLECAPADHPWRGVGREAMDPSEREALSRHLAQLSVSLETAREAGLSGAERLGLAPPQRLGDLAVIEDALSAVGGFPEGGDHRALAHTAWSTAPNALSSLAQVGASWRDAKAKAEAAFVEAAWETDLAPIRAAVVTKGRSLLRFLDGDYRRNVALLASILREPLPKTPDARIALIDAMISAKTARRAFDADKELGSAFGRAWRDIDSDWALLAEVTAWRSALPAALEDQLAKIAALEVPAEVGKIASRLSESRGQLSAAAAQMGELTSLDLQVVFGTGDWDAAPLAALAERLAAWRSQEEAISRFIAYAGKGRDLAKLGLGALVEGVNAGVLDNGSLLPAFERAYVEALRGELFKAWPELRGFDGASHQRLVDQFRQYDQQRIRLAQQHIAAGHAQARPKGASGVGPLGVLNGEIAKKRRHLPIRQLLERGGPAIQQLKPVFLMSPLSVAQFLKPGALDFDLLVVDEASQIEPVDALGAIARCNQIVVVGDERQLPPTRFFSKLTSDIEEDEDEEQTFRSSDVESILDLCLAKGVPHRMLNWHYRSKHQSLIAVSNKQFYENRLFIVPSPYDQVAGMGLRFHHLPATVYERGASRTNPLEAKIVAEAVIRHAREAPGESLGVATFSTAQRQAVLKELEVLRRANPDAEGFFSQGGAEPFFVKNLENIQGDERDVIYISLGYGKTKDGQLPHSFGPLNGDGGERRLNVLISRAKLRCEVFANFRGADLDLERSRAAGVVALKMFMTFAETGRFDTAQELGDRADRDLEHQLAAKLTALGYDVKSKVGTAGFSIGLAIGDAEKPGRFILGIETDGEQYSGARSARDRDRLRRQVLEAHGWIIHRIWAADWYLRPEEELRKLQEAIAAAQAEWRERDETGDTARRAVPLSFETTRVGDHEAEVTAVLGEVEPPAALAEEAYVEASFEVDRRVEPHEAPMRDMLVYVVRVVDAEGPIHIDEVATRIRILWGLQKAGSRIRLAVARAADAARREGMIVGEDFLALPNQAVIVRSRALVQSPSLRKPEYLPPREIEAAILKVVAENYGASLDDLVTTAARLFGFKSTSAQLRRVLEAGVETLMASGRLVLRNDLYSLGAA